MYLSTNTPDQRSAHQIDRLAVRGLFGRTHSFLRAERLFSSLTWWLGSDRFTSGSESDRLLGISSSSRSLLSWWGAPHSTVTESTCGVCFQTPFQVTYLRAAAECRLQQVAVLSHPHGEVAVALVDGGDAATELGAVGVAFGQHALGQLDQQVNLLLGVLRGSAAGEPWRFSVFTAVFWHACEFSPSRKHRTLCVGSAVPASREPTRRVTCAWPGSGHLTAAASPSPETRHGTGTIL